MSNIIKEILELDENIWKSPSRLKAYISDLNPEDKKLRNIIMVSVEEQIPKDLSDKKIVTQIDASNMINRLINASGCELEYAKKVINLWIDAFGLIIENGLYLSGNEDESVDNIIYYPIEKLDIRHDYLDCLKNARIDMIRELIILSKDEALQIKGIGKYTIKFIADALGEYNLSFRSDDKQELLYGYPSVVTAYYKETNKSWAHKLFMNVYKCNYEWILKYKKLYEELNKNKKNSYILYKNYELTYFVKDFLKKLENIIDSIGNSAGEKFESAIQSSEETGNPLFVVNALEEYFNEIKRLIFLKIAICKWSVSKRFEKVFSILTESIDELFECLDDVYYGIINSLSNIVLMEYSSSNDSCKAPIKITFDINIPLCLKTQKLETFSDEYNKALSLPIDEVQNNKSEEEMHDILLTYKLKYDGVNNPKGDFDFNSLLENIDNSNTVIKDSFGKRWFKCNYCGLVSSEYHFAKIGYNFNLNKGICKYCISDHEGDQNFRRITEPNSVVIDEKCPNCGKPLRLMHGKNGPFVGCSKYPRCKYSRNIS